MPRLSVTLGAAMAALLVAIVGACGGGGDDVTFDGETIRSSDGVLTVQIPTGAAAEGVEIEVTRIAEGELPPELQDVDGVVVVGYELGPDGAQFSQPVTLTFRVDPADHGIDLPAGDGKCNAAAGSTVPPESTETTGDDEEPEGTSTAGPPQARSSRNTSYPLDVSGASGSVDVNAGDCFDNDGPVELCPVNVDITWFGWGPVDGSPDLFRVTVGFPERFEGPGDTRVDVAFRGREGTPMGTRVTLIGGEVSCTFPASGGPLEFGPGELCEVNAAGEIEVIRNVSGLEGPLRISISTSGDGVADAVQIRGIERQ